MERTTLPVTTGGGGGSRVSGWSWATVIAGWRAGEVPGADMVANDDGQGSRLAVEHLLGLGHRRIGHLSAEAVPPSTAARRSRQLLRRPVRAG